MMPTTTIKVKHTIQMGHRLWNLPGKCENLHGHTWTVILSLTGVPNDNGILVEYGELKKRWRGYLDELFDHHFAFDEKDPLVRGKTMNERAYTYPGYVALSFVPTVENLANYWCAMAETMFGERYTYAVELWEGEVNCAIASSE